MINEVCNDTVEEVLLISPNGKCHIAKLCAEALLFDSY